MRLWYYRRVAERLNRHWIGIDITYQSISLILKRLTEQSRTALANIEINGVPKDFASAVALANKKDDSTRKEFEKWLVLTYNKLLAWNISLTDRSNEDKYIK